MYHQGAHKQAPSMLMSLIIHWNCFWLRIFFATWIYHSGTHRCVFWIMQNVKGFSVFQWFVSDQLLVTVFCILVIDSNSKLCKKEGWEICFWILLFLLLLSLLDKVIHSIAQIYCYGGLQCLGELSCLGAQITEYGSRICRGDYSCTILHSQIQIQVTNAQIDTIGNSLLARLQRLLCQIQCCY